MQIEYEKHAPHIFDENYYFMHSIGLITTTARKLDRENQAEHILEVCNIFRQRW